MSTQLPQPQKMKIPRFSNKTAFYIGLIIGGIVSVSLSAGLSFLYLIISQDSIAVKNGQVNFNKLVATNTSTNVNAPTANPSITGDKNVTVGNSGLANSGDNSQVARDPKDSFNRQTSPSVFGNNNNITIVANRDLPGFDEKSYISSPPPELSNYSNINDFQPDSIISSASDADKIQFKKNEIVILGKTYASFFYLSEYANESRFIFKLDGSQKAVLLQFGLPDLPAGSTTKGLYTIKISADGKPLWSGECKRSQGSQIISVPLGVSSKKTLTLEVTSNGKNESPLFFTEARILR